ncbi:hypothetical protein GA0061098_1007284 [Bradyrhizobium shewense]|uniref:GDSL-like Lipase/Acylhydrolase family protein n=1 Tax=Bradyrhizobium shewense TaxID=1761772 RepID=A0A1C3WF27_9BRAD|nr:hypothetical protein [Bradyrhizobium shewense]SCB38488.1 hypothetical protein GA0061098_1007284 [Bradyrhizobium shewense]
MAEDISVEMIDVRTAIDKAVPAGSTIDGVHLSNRGYDAWVATLQSGIRKMM